MGGRPYSKIMFMLLFRSLFLLSLLVVFSAFSTSLDALEHPYHHQHIDTLVLKKIVDYPLENKTLIGLDEAEQLIIKNPQIPVLYTLKCFLYLQFMFNYRTFVFKEEFLTSFKKGVQYSKAWLKMEPENAEANFFYAALNLITLCF